MKPPRAVLRPLLAGAGLFAQNRADTVTVHVVATNKGGPVRNLDARNFKVSVDNRELPVIRILDRASGEVKGESGAPASLATFARPGHSVMPIATTVATSQLAAGALSSGSSGVAR